MSYRGMAQLANPALQAALQQANAAAAGYSANDPNSVPSSPPAPADTVGLFVSSIPWWGWVIAGVGSWLYFSGRRGRGRQQ